MKSWERWTLHAATLAVAASGFAYLWMKYFIRSDDPFALVNHPWQSIMLQTHVLASPLLILVFGIVLNSHIVRKLRVTGSANRKSGLASLATFAMMVSSGYLLQVVTAEAWLTALSAAHIASGVVFVGTYATHLVISFAALRRRSTTLIREIA